ncbi:MAG: hypothetical protein AB4058_00650 [Microcystaceae cyanobacterium]
MNQSPSIGTLYRHGDVLIKRIANLPKFCQGKEGTTLAHGEVTGHSHRIAQHNAVRLWEKNQTLYLEVIEPSATLIHEEHNSIELPQGIYQVWKQREYRPDAYIDVED